MAKHTLTERKVRTARCPAGATETTIYDGDGLCLRVRATADAKSPQRAWQFWYTRNGRRQRIGLGAYPEIGLKDARDRADRYRELLRAGITPTKAIPTLTPNDVPLIPRTVDDLMNRWRANYLAHNHKDGGAASEAAYRRHIGPAIGATRLVDVRKLHVLHIVNALTAAGKGRTAAGTLAMLRQMFNWAIRQDFVAADPTAALKKSEYAGKTVSRDRVLSGDELRELATRLQASRRAGPKGRERVFPVLPLATQASVWVMLATLARVGELSRARWDNIDLDARTWIIPATNSKNEKPHLVHLSPFAIRHLRHLQQYAGADAEWVLPNARGSGHLDVQAITKQLRDRQQPATTAQRKGRSVERSALHLPGGDFTAHDLRRTGATIMQSLGVASEVIERCLNHVERDALVRTYQRAELLPERAEAFAKLGAQLDRLAPAAATAHLAIRGTRP